MYRERRKRPTLMPAVALAALGALITIPTLSNARLYAAPPERFEMVTVHQGDTLWTIAEAHTPAGSDVEESIDTIVSANHLSGTTVYPGQTIRIPR